jgi:hypothetical protein
LRYLTWALDGLGAVLFIAGACGLAYLVHPLFAVLCGGVLLIVAGAVAERYGKADKS